jgi:ABC-type polysaccharide/polyol phosphate transport system ATPase subunit
MTLLKMLNGLIKPDAGSITMRGRVGALTALGAGFPRLSALDARHLFPSMAPCSGSRKPIEIFFINTNLKL